MRVIAGKFKGRKLLSPKNAEIRPTSDRMKEAIFSIIESRKYSSNLNGKKFLDLFSGSGSIGIEALSRGAKAVYMVENDKYSLELINQNIDKLNLNKDDKKKIIIKKTNVFLLDSSNYPFFDFIYIDPPYEMKKYKDILSLIYEKKLLNINTLILFETGESNIQINELFHNLVCKKFSNCYLNILQLKS